MAKNKNRHLATEWILTLPSDMLFKQYFLCRKNGSTWGDADDRMVRWLVKTKNPPAHMKPLLNRAAWQHARYVMADREPERRWKRHSYDERRTVERPHQHPTSSAVQRPRTGDGNPVVQHCPECGQLAEVEINCKGCGLSVTVTRSRPSSPGLGKSLTGGLN